METGTKPSEDDILSVASQKYLSEWAAGGWLLTPPVGRSPSPAVGGLRTSKQRPYKALAAPAPEDSEP